MKVSCPSCGAGLAIPDDKAQNLRLKLQCPGCQNKFSIGEATGQAPTAAASPAAGKARPTAKKKVARKKKKKAKKSSTSEINPVLVGAAVGALIGCVIWVVVARFTGSEFGFAGPWILGGIVGAGARSTAGMSSGTGLVAAGAALVAILLGKFLVVLIGTGTNDFSDYEYDYYEEEFAQMQAYAADYPDFALKEDVAKFMIKHEYTWEAESPDDVTEEAVEEFKEYAGNEISRFKEQDPTFEEYKKWKIEEELGQSMDEYGFTDRLKYSFGLFDWLAIAFGVATAFKAGSKNS